MSQTRIVAVDDDRRILRLLKRACEGVGYEMHSVLDAAYFESALRGFGPSLVFLDLNMRDIDGVELLRVIAGRGRGTSVVLTSGVDEYLLGAAHALGHSLGLDMLEPIRKPLIVADVHRRLDTHRQRAGREPRARISAARLGEAIEHHLVDVVYQPVVELSSGRTIAVEALARLRQPGRELLMPENFIPVAERCGLIDRLTFRVLDRALSDLQRWSAFAPDLELAVNLSPLLLNDEQLPGRLAAMLSRHRVAARRLIMEVTETGMPDDRGRMAEILHQLRDLGIALALDDFGTGFCSLGQLYEFPYQTLKLDRKFAMNAEHDGDAAAMIRSSLGLAHSAGLRVVAEGIQSDDVLRWLALIGCDAGQGFHLSPPLSTAATGAWLSRPGTHDVLGTAPLTVQAIGAA